MNGMIQQTERQVSYGPNCMKSIPSLGTSERILIPLTHGIIYCHMIWDDTLHNVKQCVISNIQHRLTRKMKHCAELIKIVEDNQ